VEAFKGNAPASDSDLQAFEANFGTKLPREYVLFLKKTNGVCGFVGANYLDLYPVERLPEYNRGCGVNKYAPELFLFWVQWWRRGLRVRP
jgi:hypothetical protein